MRNFATEGTPLALSNSGSHTNLSTLTMDKDDDGSSDSDGDLLAAVAQRGERPLGGGGGGGGARHPVNLPSSRNIRSRSSLGVREEGEGRVGVRAAATKVTSGPIATAAAARAAAQRRGGGSLA